MIQERYYSEKKNIGPLTLANMRAVEYALYHNESCSRKQLQSSISALIKTRESEKEPKKVSERTVQNIIKFLNEWYSGKNKICMKRATNSDGPIYTLENRIHLRFPEIITECNEDDRDVLRLLIQIATLHNLPVKKFAERISQITDISDAIGIASEPFYQFGELFCQIFDAMFNKRIIKIDYSPKNKAIENGKEINVITKVISPLMLRCYNNRWYLIAHAHEPNPYDWSVFPLDRIKRVSPYDKSKEFSKIKVSLIRDYYDKVIGFDVPWNKIKGNSLNNPKRRQLASDLIVTPICIKFKNDKTFRYIANNPIHPSQRVNTGEFSILLNVVENDALYKKLMIIGADISSISPDYIMDHLRLKIADIYNNLINRD